MKPSGIELANESLFHVSRWEAMDENELRIAALEKVVLALAPWITADAIEDAAATIRAEIRTTTGRERVASARRCSCSPMASGGSCRPRWGCS
jgi:hypothetical protein